MAPQQNHMTGLMSVRRSERAITQLMLYRLPQSHLDWTALKENLSAETLPLQPPASQLRMHRAALHSTVCTSVCLLPSVSLRAPAPGCSVGVELVLAYCLATVVQILIAG